MLTNFFRAFTHNSFINIRLFFISFIFSLSFINTSFALPVKNSITQVKLVHLDDVHFNVAVCVISIDKKLYCWETLGDSLRDSNKNRIVPIQVLNNVTSFTVGDLHMCAIKTGGDLYCWVKHNVAEALCEKNKICKKPLKILEDVASISSSSDYVCALKKNGDLYCWQFKYSTKSNNGGIQIRYKSPKKIMKNVKKVELSKLHSCAIKDNDELYCWGDNSSGQIGNGTTNNQVSPIKIMNNVSNVVLGIHSTCAIKTNGDLYCWGYNLGFITPSRLDFSLTPQNFMQDIDSVSLGRYLGMVPFDGDVCALRNDGKVFCSGQFQKLLDPDDHVFEWTPSYPKEIIDNVVKVDTGDMHSCVIQNNGKLFCWGQNNEGQIGNGSRRSTDSPVEIMEDVLDVSVAGATTCALKYNGKLYCWGYLSIHHWSETPQEIFDGSGLASIDVVTPKTELPIPLINNKEEVKEMVVKFPKIYSASINKNLSKDNEAEFKYQLHIRKVKRLSNKDNFYQLGKVVTTFHKRSEISLKNMDKGIYLVRYRVIITKGNKEKATKWSKRVRVQI